MVSRRNLSAVSLACNAWLWRGVSSNFARQGRKVVRFMENQSDNKITRSVLIAVALSAKLRTMTMISNVRMLRKRGRGDWHCDASVRRESRIKLIDSDCWMDPSNLRKYNSVQCLATRCKRGKYIQTVYIIQCILYSVYYTPGSENKPQHDFSWTPAVDVCIMQHE